MLKLRNIICGILSTFFLPALSSCGYGQVKHVILISIDGLHPDMYLDASWPAPNLRELMKQGTYADYCLSVFPSYTYPSHTAMVTGALPARSGINFNQPIGSKGDWFWYTKVVKATTLWQALKAKGMITAAIQWPVSVTNDITWNFPEIWSNESPDDRVTESRRYATPGLIEAIESDATGKLDSVNFNDNCFSLDENVGRAAAYIFTSKKPAFMAVHFACVDGKEHDDGRDADSVRLALASADHAVGDLLAAVEKSKEKANTDIIIVGDHGFATINQVMRVNILIKNLPVRFIAAGGSSFLYHIRSNVKMNDDAIIKAVTDSLNSLPKDKRRLFRIIDRKELDKMGADSGAILALTAAPGLVFSGASKPNQTINHGPGTLIQNNKLEGVFIPSNGGHHGYDPDLPEMHTGFIAAGTGIIKGGHIKEMKVVNIAPLIAKLLQIEFNTPDGKLEEGILTN